jgi:galactokinase
MTGPQLAHAFQQRYHRHPRLFRAPGRVNLIGEHTDYNDGFVFPMALDRYTTAAIADRPDRMVRVYSVNMEEEITFSLDENRKRRDHWSDYVAGIAAHLELQGFRLPGADLLLYSEVPVGSGLSSSAALEISSALAFTSLIDARIPGIQLAKLGQAAENQFVGMNCGIMDQFISVHGREDHALFLDCRSLEYQLVPLPSDRTRIVVCNTMVKHELGASEYNSRRRECETGVRAMQGRWPEIKALRDLTLTQFESAAGELDEVVRKRCRHVISEDERVLNSIRALQAGDLRQFGTLMNRSHDSLRDDYQVSCAELDAMVDIARGIEGCLGARMTGGGFGGCTVNLVALEAVSSFCDRITAEYQARIGLTPAVYISVPSQGAHEWKTD